MLQSASEKNPKSIEAFSSLGRVQYVLNRFVEAQMAYKSAIALDPQNASLHKELAKVYLKQGNSSELVTTIQKCHELGGADEQTYFWLGKGLEKEDKTSEALAAYHKSIELKAKNYEAQFAVSKIYLGQENYDGAAKAFRSALTADPKGFPAAYNYAVAMESKDQEAIDQLLRSIESDAARAKKVLSRIHSQASRPSRGDQELIWRIHSDEPPYQTLFFSSRIMAW